MELRYLYLAPVCLAVAGLFLIVERTRRYVAADVVKGVASACFVLLGFLGALLGVDADYARVILLGLLLGAVADVLLNLRYVFEGSRSQLAFLSGILVFLAGHVAYLLACLPHCPFLVVAVVAGVVLTALLMSWIFGPIEAKLVFKLFGVVYVGAVVVLTCVALGALAAHPSTRWLAFVAGTALFLASDVVLILNNFGPRQSVVMRISNIVLYYAAQLLIALSIQLPL